MRSLLIGVEGMTLPLLARAVAGNQAPSLKALLEHGRVTTVPSQWAHSGPTDWVTVATGSSPGAHGVLWPDEAWAGGIRAATMSSWARQPFWDLLARAGFVTASVAWPATSPGDSHHGLHVDERAARTSGQRREAWSLPLRSLPEGLREHVRELRIHPQDLVEGEAGPDFAVLPIPGREIAARALSAAAIAKDIVCRYNPDCLAVHFETALSGTGISASQAWLALIETACANLLRLTGPDTQILLVSPGTQGHDGILITSGPSSALQSPVLTDLAPAICNRFDVSWAAHNAQSACASDPAAMPTGYALPTPPSARWRAARLARLATLVLSEDPSKAADLTAQVIALMPREIEFLDLHATALVAARRFTDLALIAARMRAVAPDDPRAALAEAVPLALAGEHQAAAHLLDRVHEEGDHSLRLRAAQLWQASGRFDLAASIRRDLSVKEKGCS